MAGCVYGLMCIWLGSGGGGGGAGSGLGGRGGDGIVIISCW